MKLTHKFMILGLCLSSVACSNIDKKTQDAAEESCAAEVECAGQDAEDENECISETLDEMEETRKQVGDECFELLLDMQGCFAQNYTCSDGDVDITGALAECSDELGDVLGQCPELVFENEGFEDGDFDDFDDEDF